MNQFHYPPFLITFLGHAGFRLEVAGKILYIDPYRVNEGPAADVVLITHEHYDHLDQNSLQKISKSNRTLILSSQIAGREILRQQKTYKQLQTLTPGQNCSHATLSIQAVSAYNLSKPFHRPGVDRLGFIIKNAEVSIYHSGDTDFIPEMGQLGKVEVALLPIGGTYTMNEEEAVLALQTIKPQVVIPMHYGNDVIATGNPDKFERLVGDLSRVVILRP